MSTERNYLFDNTKALLITLVVVGHFADYYTKTSEDMKIIFFIIYLFHMPLFIFIAGLFSKSVINGARFKIEKVFNYILLFIILKMLFYLMNKYIFLNENAEITFFIEGGLPWFMFAMAAWLSLTYLLRNIKPVYLMIVSVLLAILVGYDARVTDFLVTSRIIVYYPYFLLGYYLDPKRVSNLVKLKKVKVISYFILVSGVLVIITQIEKVYPLRLFLTGRNPYEIYSIEILGGPVRLMLMLITVVISIAILAVISEKKQPYSIIGKRTLQIYFLHHLILSAYHHFKLNDILAVYFSTDWLKVYILLSLILTIVLTSKTFEVPFNYINSFHYKCLQKNNFEPKSRIWTNKS